jgi:indolepyruvate ferredoxin oxidoreductase beta subunit
VRFDVLLAGVGGQGVLSLAAIVTEAARVEGLHVKQAEVHGMAQRGGSVQATVRISSDPIESELVSYGVVDMILGLEPLEALRYVDYLASGSGLITAADPYENILDYPPLDSVHEQVRLLGGHLIDASRLAREAGSPRSSNVVMVGSASTLAPLPVDAFEAAIRRAFASKGDRVVEANLRAFRLGREALTPAQG